MCFILHPICDNSKAPDLKRARLFAECDHYSNHDKRNLGDLHKEHRAKGLPAPDDTWAVSGTKTWVQFEDYRWIIWPPRLCLRYAASTTSIELCQDCASLFDEVNPRLRPSDAVGSVLEEPDPTMVELFGDAAHVGLRIEKPAPELKNAKIKPEKQSKKIKREPR